MVQVIYIIIIILLIYFLYKQITKRDIKLNSSNQTPQKTENFSSTQEPLGRELEMSPVVLGSYASPEVEQITRYDSVIVPESFNTFDELNMRRIIKNQQLAKRAIDGIVRNTKNSYAKYFQEELENNESQDWWSEESDPDQTDLWSEDDMARLTEQPSYGN